MHITELNVGSASIRVDVSEDSRAWLTVRSYAGNLTAEEVTAGIDIDALTEAVLAIVGGCGFILMVVAFTDGPIALIEANRFDDCSEVTAVRFDADVVPDCVIGRWG